MGSKILYVDDEVDLVEIAASIFEDEGLRVDTATTYQAALEKLRTGNYKLLISDVNLQTGNGHELIKRVREEKCFDGKVLLVCGNMDDQRHPAAGSYDRIVLKPVDFIELVDAVKNLI